MKFARRFCLVFAAVALVLVGMVAAFYGIEDWRGAHAWTVCRQDLVARGERLDAAAFIPPAVPDDQNLAMAPLFVRLYKYEVDPATRLLTFPKPVVLNDLSEEITNMPRGSSKQGKADFPHSGGDWTNGHALDLAAWQQYYRQRPDFPHVEQPQNPAEDVLLALTRYGPILDELAQAAAARPKTRFPVNWTTEQPSTISLPHYNAMQCMVSTLRLRIAANLALRRSDAAMRDLALAWRLIGITAADSNLIAQLVSVTELGMTVQPIWEGLNARRWSAAELQQIKTGLSGLDYLAGYRQAIRCERAFFFIKTVDYFKAHDDLPRAILSLQGDDNVIGTNGFLSLLIRLIPGGWYDQNKAIGCQFMQVHHIDVVDPTAHHVHLAQAKAGATAEDRIAVSPYTGLVKIVVPVYTSTFRTFAAFQADVDHAVIACALEQFYLDRQAYPAQLDELVPTYLNHVPVDLIDGAPTRYKRAPDGRYALWSIGWNGQDDSGRIAFQKDSARRDNNQGDWVWQYEPLQLPAKIQRNK